MISHARLILAVAVMAAIASGIAIMTRGLPTYYALGSFVGQDNRSFADLERFMSQFGVGELALVAVHSGNVFDEETLECLEQLVARIERLRVTQSIRCIVQVPALVRRVVASSPLVRGILVSDDQRTAAVVMQMRLDDTAGHSRRATVTALAPSWRSRGGSFRRSVWWPPDRISWPTKCSNWCALIWRCFAC